uniref:Uncharacterized protein n=1 Tax=Leersia perrieri TaxID=77586 RepID=A0A0D9XTJ3_9ORYZ
MTPPAKRRRLSPPELNADVTGEILLRLAPDDPALLVRCSLVCKSWRRLLTADPVFLRRRREFHSRRRPPPLLGFLFNQFFELPDVACFAPTSSLRRLPHPHHHDWSALDARHDGLVLFHAMLSCDAEEAAGEHQLVVWDPMTGRRWGIDFPSSLENFNFSAALLCAADGCDHHRHCNGGVSPFLVAVASTGRYGLTSAAIYSSETGAWGDEIEHEGPDDAVKIGNPGVQVGNAIYFLCIGSARIVELDTSARNLTMFDSPVAGRGWLAEQDNGLLITAEGGGGGVVGFAFARGSMLYLWSREATGGDGAMKWTPRRGINLDPLLLTVPRRRRPHDHFITEKLNLVGFADGIRVIFAEIGGEVFTIEVSSRRGKRVYRREGIHAVIPFMSFYTPSPGTNLPVPIEQL